MPAMRPSPFTLLLVSLSLASCDGRSSAPAPGSAPTNTTPSPAPTPVAPVAAPSPAAVTRLPAPARLVAIGDVHGDFAATVAALRLAGAIDEQQRWSGGPLVVVQTGDQLDRGDGERQILDLLERLQGEARSAGGALHVLNGNHELMNAAGDLRYVTAGGFVDFAEVPGIDLSDRRAAAVQPVMRARLLAFAPGGPYARKLATRPVILVHGTGGDMTVSWNLISPELAAKGYCVFALDYGNRGTGPIEESAVQLGSFVDRVQVAAHADAGLAMKPCITASIGPVHEEDALAISDDDIGNELLESRILLRSRTVEISTLGGDRGAQLFERIRIGLADTVKVASPRHTSAR